MGIIADRFKAQLDEMKARHAQTDREIAVLKREVDESLAALIASTDELLKNWVQLPRYLYLGFFVSIFT